MIDAMSIALGIALLGTVLQIHLASRPILLDLPNVRGSHQHPTPRGGETEIVLGVIAGTFALAGQSPMAKMAPLCIALPVGLLEHLDNRFNLPTRPQLTCHLVSAVTCVLSVHSVIPPHSMLSTSVLLAAIGVVSGTNLPNFMEGFDNLDASAGSMGNTYFCVQRFGFPNLSSSSWHARLLRQSLAQCQLSPSSNTHVARDESPFGPLAFDA
jgi:UDP-GlcNAc:undecaprenyl-phosphate GlcNAc-1-phosphate transferase